MCQLYFILAPSGTSTRTLSTTSTPAGTSSSEAPWATPASLAARSLSTPTADGVRMAVVHSGTYDSLMALHPLNIDTYNFLVRWLNRPHLDGFLGMKRAKHHARILPSVARTTPRWTGQLPTPRGGWPRASSRPAFAGDALCRWVPFSLPEDIILWNLTHMSASVNMSVLIHNLAHSF